MTDEVDFFLLTEAPAGGLLDPKNMEELKRRYMQGCWFWHCDDQMMMYWDLAFQKLIGRDHH